MTGPSSINLGDIAKIAEYAKEALDAIGTLLSVGKDVTSLIEQTRERLDAMAAANRGPTDEEWAAQNKMIDELSADLDSDG